MWNSRDNNRLKITRSFACCGGSHRARNGGRSNFSAAAIATAIAAALKMCRRGIVLLGHRTILFDGG